MKSSTASVGDTTTMGQTSLLLWDPLAAPDVKTLVLAMSKDPNPKITALLFWPGCSCPWGAAKVPTTPASREAVEREAALLAEIHSRYSDDILRTVPRRYPSLEAALPEGTMVVEALPGVSLGSRYARSRRICSRAQATRDFLWVEGWLCRMTAATTRETGPIAYGDDVVRALRSRFASDGAVENAMRILVPLASGLSRSSGPKAVVHGDLWIGNILTDDAGITGVVDWESGQLVGEPLRDVARFAVTYALYLDRRTKPGRRVRGHNVVAGEWGAGVRYALEGLGWFPELVREFVRRNLRRLGAEPSLWPGLMLLGLAEIAATADDEPWARQHLDLLNRLGESAAWQT